MKVRVDIEKELDVCVRSLGGVVLDDEHGPKDPTKADYWFPQENVVGELKCLSDNYFDDLSFNGWLQRKYEDWVRRNLANPISLRSVINLANLPPICAHEVTSFLRKRLDGSLKQANLQIKASRQDLGATSALGLLILVNDGNVALPPGMIRNIVARSLPNKFSGINSIIHFTANMPSDLPGIDKDVLFWCDWNAKRVRPAVSNEFIRRIRSTWTSHHSKLAGESISSFSGSIADLYNLKFVK